MNSTKWCGWHFVLRKCYNIYFGNLTVLFSNAVLLICIAFSNYIVLYFSFFFFLNFDFWLCIFHLFIYKYEECMKSFNVENFNLKWKRGKNRFWYLSFPICNLCVDFSFCLILSKIWEVDCIWCKCIGCK